jgi:hypothetical protein
MSVVYIGKMKLPWTKSNILMGFIPIILIFIFVKYTNAFIHFSHTILGKMVMVALIIYYTMVDKIYGTLICILVIFYYQSDRVEGLTTGDTENPFKKDEESMESGDKTGNLEKPEKPGKTENNVYDKFSKVESYESSTINFDKTHEEAKNLFRKSYCENGHLKYKGQTVKPDVAQHVFPEIAWNAERCNICDPTCDFSIIESRIQMEKELQPKSSN